MTRNRVVDLLSLLGCAVDAGRAGSQHGPSKGRRQVVFICIVYNSLARRQSSPLAKKIWRFFRRRAMFVAAIFKTDLRAAAQRAKPKILENTLSGRWAFCFVWLATPSRRESAGAGRVGFKKAPRNQKKFAAASAVFWGRGCWPVAGGDEFVRGVQRAKGQFLTLCPARSTPPSAETNPSVLIPRGHGGAKVSSRIFIRSAHFGNLGLMVLLQIGEFLRRWVE